MSVTGDTNWGALAKETCMGLGTGLLSGVAVNMITGPLFDAIGIPSGTPDYTSYLNEISTQLSDLTSDLNQNMVAIQSGLAVIRAGIAVIESQLEDSEYQTALQIYTENANAVNEAFKGFVDAAAGLANTDTTVQQSSISDLYQSLSYNSAQAVATAMANIHSELYGQGAMKGMIAYQGIVCQNAVSSWAGDSNNLLANSPLEAPSWWVDNLSIVTTAAPSALPGVIETSVIPALKAALIVELQGLLFLTAAWAQNEEAPQLEIFVTNLQSQITAIGSLYTSLTAPASFDPFIQGLVQQLGVPCPGEFIQHIVWENMNVRPTTINEWQTPPIDASWLTAMDTNGPDAPQAICLQPPVQAGQNANYFAVRWLWGPPACFTLSNTQSALTPSTPGPPAVMALPAPHTYLGNPPQAWTGFVAGLTPSPS